MTTDELLDDAAVEFFPTPIEVTERFLRLFKRAMRPAPLSILEPAAGSGAMLGPLRAVWPLARVDACDIQPQHPDVMRRPFYFDDEPGGYDLVITNPPFSMAREFVDYGLTKLNAGGTLVLLLRLGFLASKERAGWWPERKPHHLYPLAGRPSFRRSAKSATDFNDYAWYVWRNNGGRKHATQITWGC